MTRKRPRVHVIEQFDREDGALPDQSRLVSGYVPSKPTVPNLTINTLLHHRQILRDLNLDGLTDAITVAIEQSRAYDHDAVTVASRGGIIVLTGLSKSCVEKQIALDLAWKVPGVTGIEDNLVLDGRGA